MISSPFIIRALRTLLKNVARRSQEDKHFQCCMLRRLISHLKKAVAHSFMPSSIMPLSPHCIHAPQVFIPYLLTPQHQHSLPFTLKRLSKHIQQPISFLGVCLLRFIMCTLLMMLPLQDTSFVDALAS